MHAGSPCSFLVCSLQTEAAHPGARRARATRFAEGRARREAPRDYYYYCYYYYYYYYYSVYLHYPTDYFKLSDYPTTTSNTIRLLLQILYFKYYPTDYFKYSVYHIIRGIRRALGREAANARITVTSSKKSKFRGSVLPSRISHLTKTRKHENTKTRKHAIRYERIKS